MTIHVTPIPSTLELAAPAFTLGTANTAGAALTAISSNSTLLVYDATAPVAAALTATGGAGDSTVAARRNHVHGAALVDGTAPSASALTATGAGGSATVAAKRDHVHGAALVDGTAPTSWGVADTATGGSATVASKRDHLHGNLLAFTLARLYGH